MCNKEAVLVYHQWQIDFSGCTFWSISISCHYGSVPRSLTAESSSSRNKKLRTFLSSWFSLSLPVFAVAMIFGSLLISVSFFRVVVRIFTIFWRTGEGVSTNLSPNLAVPVIPGVTFPIEKLPVLLFAIAVSVTFHELGHAACCYGLRVPVRDFGFFSVCFAFAAYVKIDVASLQWKNLSVVRKACIYASGVWHNFVLYLTCLLALHLVGLSFDHGKFLRIISVSSESPLHSVVGDFNPRQCLLFGINGESVKTIIDFHHVLEISLHDPTGYCFSFDQWKSFQANSLQCCSQSPLEASSAPETAPNCFVSISPELSACFKARKVIGPKAQKCEIPSADCSVCAVPMFSGEIMRITIIELECNGQTLEPILYAGHPGDLAFDIRFSSFNCESGLADVICEFLNVIMSVSMSIGLLNSLPVFFFDGQQVLSMVFAKVLNLGVCFKIASIVLFLHICFSCFLLFLDGWR
eukprot:TRINITY_DN17234_c0_g1_i1.p1 TRINITY_DN17234_c0_g1~~TRINITY_DN17234_c0_g1_i1.p1  ORF type:complete len:481 (+),score=84.68 TRINITY_DN17234_c0_g1_i1:48-1445(+)